MIRQAGLPTFKSIYQNRDITFSNAQMNVIDDAVSKLRTTDKKGKTFENKHKKWDFYFDGEKNNSVSLTAYHRSKVDKSTGEVFNDFSRLVGIYGKNKKFAISDIKNVIHDYVSTHVLIAAGTLLVLTAAIGNYFIHQQREKNSNSQTEIIKNNTENKFAIPDDYNLTDREKEVLGYICSGLNNCEISKILDVSINTVKVHVSSIIQKMEVEDRTQVVVKAFKNYGK